jgi:biotin carboxyl carrier protein
VKVEIIAATSRRWTAEVAPAADGVTVRLDDEAAVARLDPVAGSECWRLVVGRMSVPVRVREARGRLSVTVGAARVDLDVRRALPVASRQRASAAGTDRVEVRAPMPGLVVAIPVGRGAPVSEGTAVAVIEAMKMQMEVPAPTAGRIEDVRVAPGQEVGGGQVLVVLATSDETTRPEEMG